MFYSHHLDSKGILYKDRFTINLREMMGKFKNFLKNLLDKYYYLIILILFIVLSLIFGFTLDWRDFIVIEATLVVVIPILTYISRKAGKRYYERKKLRPSRSLYVHGLRKGEPRSTRRRVLTSMAGRGGGSASPVIAMGEQEYIDIMTGRSRIYDKEDWNEKTHPQTINEYLKEESVKSTVVKDINENLREMHAENIMVQQIKEDVVLSFDFPAENEFSFLLKVILKITKEDKFILESIFRKYQPFTFSARIFEVDDPKLSNSFNSKTFDSFYTVNYSHSLDFQLLQDKTNLQETLIKLTPSLELLFINRKHISVAFCDYSNIHSILRLMEEIYSEFLEQKIGVRAVVDIECYVCGAKLDENDLECPKCKAKRPRCSVCLLDLQPSEKEKVVQTPCCGVYSHSSHLMMWLEKTHTCPNCKSNQARWLEKLKKSK